MAYVAGSAAYAARQATATPTLTLGAAVSVGDIIVVCYAHDTSTSDTEPTDSLGNTYSFQGSPLTDAFFDIHRVATARVTTGGTPTITFHLPGTPSAGSFAAAAYSGRATTSWVTDFDSAEQATPGTATDAVTCPALTTTAGDDVIFFMVGIAGNTAVFSAGTTPAFVERLEQGGTPGVDFNVGITDRLNVAGGSLTPVGTTSDDNRTVSFGISLAAAAGSPFTMPADTATFALTGNAVALTVTRVPTRFYLSSTATPSVSPAFEAGWGRTTEGDRRVMSPTKDSSAATNKTVWANGTVAANGTALARQYVSAPLAAGFVFQTTDTFKCYIRAMESAANDNINRQPICVKVVSNDGTTVQATLKTLGHYGPNTTEWIVTPTLTNKTWGDNDALATGYTTVAGDRLVIEIGAQCSSAGGTTVTGTLSFGSDSASDTGENETDTAANNPWFEINRSLTFQTASTLTANSGSYALTGQATGLLVARKVTANAGTYALSGQAVLFHRGFYLPAAADEYDLTGSDAGLLAGHQLAAAAGTYALTGQDVILTKATDRVMVASAGSYAITGRSVAFSRGRTMAAATRTYALTGQAVNLLAGHRLVAAAATYTYTGVAVTITPHSPPGSYTLTGNAVSLKAGHRLVATSGTYALTGQTTGFIRALRMPAVSGTYALNGQSVALSFQTATAFTLGANPGSYVITGGSNALLAGHRLTASTTSYSLTGVSIGLNHTAPSAFDIIAEAGTYALSGTAAGLYRGASFPAASGSYALTGSAIAFHTTFHLLATRGSYLLTGQTVTLTGPPPTLILYPGKYEAEWRSAVVDIRDAGIA